MSGDRGTHGSGEGAEIFERWYRAHHDRVLAQCTRLLRDRAAAEDIAQETLLRAWAGREQMREEDLGAWLSVVARNLCISHIRRQKKQIPTEILPETPDETADPAHLVERLESRRAVRRAMRQVGERHRKVLHLRDIEEVDYEDLGAELGLTPAGTRTVLFRARRVLRDRLAAVGEGMAGIVAGVRVRVAGVARRVTDAFPSIDQLGSQALQAGVALLMVTGATFAGSSAFGAGDPLGSRIQSRSVALPPETVAVNDGSRSDIAGPADAGVTGGSGGADATGRDFDPPDVPKADAGFDHSNGNRGNVYVTGPNGGTNGVDTHDYDDGTPCKTCDQQDLAWSIVCGPTDAVCVILSKGI